MKIAIVTEICNAHSGIRVPVELAKKFAQHHQVTFIAYDLATDRLTKNELKNQGVKVILLKVSKIPALGKFFGATKIVSVLKKQKPDIISFHATFPLLFFSKLSGIPIVKSYYGFQKNAFLERYPPNQKIPIWGKLLNSFFNQLLLVKEKLYFMFPDKTIAISQYTATEAKKLFGQKIDYIYLGGDSLLKYSSSKLSTQTILSVSRFTPYKGFHSLINAFKKVNKKFPKTKLVLAGSAPRKNYLAYLKKIKNKNTQILLNPSDKKLANLYQNCDIYATCDRYLFFGLPPVEAAHFGKPAVALNYCAAPEIIHHSKTGYLANNLADFITYLEKLVKNVSLRKRFGERAKKMAVKLFSWDKISINQEKVFASLLEKKEKETRVKKSLVFPFFIAIITLIIFGLPHLLIPYLLGGFKKYQPLVVNKVPQLTMEETFLYAAQTREIYDNHTSIADYNLIEYENLPSAIPPLPPLLTGSLAKLTHSLAMPIILSDFLLPPLIFLTVLFFLFQLTSDPLVSSLGGVLILTADRLFQFIPPLTIKMAQALWSILTIDGTETDPLEFSRLFYPQLVFLFLILYLFLLYLALKRKKIFLAFLSSILLGTLFYSYFYYWTFALAGSFILLVIFLIQKKNSKAKILSGIIIGALLISIPFWISFWKFRTLPNITDILERTGIERGRIRNTLRTLQYLIFGAIFFLLTKKKNLSFWVLLAFLLGGIACLNVQLITGFTYQSWHWTLRVLNPLSIIMLSFLFSKLFYQAKTTFRKRFYSPFLIFIISFFLLRGLILQIVVAKNSYQGYTLPKTTLEAFNWLNLNTPKDSVILTPSFETNMLIPTYTHNNVFLPNGVITFASNEEILKRLFTAYKIFKLKKDALEQILVYSGNGFGIEGKNCRNGNCLVDFDFLEKQAVTFLFHMKYLKKNESLFSWSTILEIPKETQQEILHSYEEFQKTPAILPSDFRLDYIYYGPAEKLIKDIDLGKYNFLKEVYYNPNVRIFKVLH